MLNAMFGDDYDFSTIEIVGQVNAHSNAALASQILTATLGLAEHAEVSPILFTPPQTTTMGYSNAHACTNSAMQNSYPTFTAITESSTTTPSTLRLSLPPQSVFTTEGLEKRMNHWEMILEKMNSDSLQQLSEGITNRLDGNHNIGCAHIDRKSDEPQYNLDDTNNASRQHV